MELSREDKIQLGALCTRDEAGVHFTQLHDLEWLTRMEQAELITITRPIHEPTGLRYSPEYWEVAVAPEVATWFDEQGQLITVAQALAARFGNDGQAWETTDGESFSDVMAAHRMDRQIDATRGLRRYIFVDGSAIVEGESGWDIEGRTPFSWAGLE